MIVTRGMGRHGTARTGAASAGMGRILSAIPWLIIRRFILYFAKAVRFGLER